MSINLNTNFKIPANIPIDSRFVFETITDMNNLASNDPKSLYNGLISYVKENSTFYRFYKDETLPSPVGSFTKILDEHGLRFYRNAVNIKTDLTAYNSDSEEGSLVFVKEEQQFYVRTKEIGSDGNPTGNLIWKELIDPNNGNHVALPGLVTQVKDGLMSSVDKTKLDGILIDKISGSTSKFLNEQGNFTDFVVDAKNVNYNPPAGSRLTATTVQGAFDEVLDKVSNIDDSAATTSTTSTYSISKINDLLRSKSNTGHNHSVTDITDLTANYYTQAQVDSKIKNAANAMIWQPPVNEIADLATTYPNPENGWTVIVQNENSFYRYNGTTWVNFGTMQFNSLVTSSENGLMSSADKIKLDKIDENAPRIYYSSTEPPRVNGNIWVVD